MITLKNSYLSLLLIFCFLVSLSSCSNDQSLNAKFSEPKPVPDGVKKGTPLGDARVNIYNKLGVITYMNPDTSRFISDVVSDQGTLNLDDAQRADSSAAILCIHMLQDELYDQLPEGKKKLMPRNFYFVKGPLTSGSGYYKIIYDAYLWTNSTHDVTIGNLQAANLDTTALEGSFYYGLASILRSLPQNSSLYNQFTTVRTDAQQNQQAYYFYVQDQKSAYKNGFVSPNQSKISGPRLDFDTYGAWAVTVAPSVRDSVLDAYPLVAQKYQLVSAMFNQEGMNLKKINTAWHDSKYNPDSN